jgi:diaminopimelate decarboxylase
MGKLKSCSAITGIQQVLVKRKHSNNAPICAYIYDLNALREHVHSIVTTLPRNCYMYYAMKANSDRQILVTLAPEVHGFEAASLGEIKHLRSLSKTVPLIFGGPGKTDEELRGAILNGVSLIHVESVNELQRLNWIAEQLALPISIMLRVNLRDTLPQATLQMGGRASQFGIDENQLVDVIDVLKYSCPWLQLQGFHLHSISNQMSVQHHLHLIQHYLSKVKAWELEFGISAKTINFGGGIGVNYENTSEQFDWTSFSRGLEAILKQEGSDNRTFIFECGRFLTAFCGYYAAEVLDIKSNHNRTYIILKGGTQHFRLPASWQHNHPFEIIALQDWDYPFSRPIVQNEAVTLVGQLCTPKDVFASEVQVEQISMGDIVVFQQAGAYGWSISHHDFLSHPHPEFIYLQ